MPQMKKNNIKKKHLKNIFILKIFKTYSIKTFWAGQFSNHIKMYIGKTQDQEKRLFWQKYIALYN